MFPVTYVQFPVQSANFPVSILREFGGNALNLFANAEGRIAITSLKRQISLYFPAKQGISETETGSPMTASTAIFLKVERGHKGSQRSDQSVWSDIVDGRVLRLPRRSAGRQF
jgi:hypothetical protein